MRIQISSIAPPSNPYALLPIFALIVCDDLEEKSLSYLNIDFSPWRFSALHTVLGEVDIFQISRRTLKH